MGINLLELAREKRKQTQVVEEIVTISPCMQGLPLTSSTIKDAIINHAQHGRTVLLSGYAMTLTGGTQSYPFVVVRQAGPASYEVLCGSGCPYALITTLIEMGVGKEFNVHPTWDMVEISRIRELAWTREHLDLGGD